MTTLPKAPPRRLRILVYKRTHVGDPDVAGRFGINHCMGSVRGYHYDAVIGVGGMGREAALLFTAEGAQVCAADVNLAAAEETASLCSGDAIAVEVDVADEAQVSGMMRATAERFGGIDVLYNNAGISPADDASILHTELDAWERVQASSSVWRIEASSAGEMPALL